MDATAERDKARRHRARYLRAPSRSHPRKRGPCSTFPGGTHCNAAEALLRQGARSTGAYVTHGVLSGGAVARIASSPIEMMTITDSILATEAVKLANNVRQLTIAPLMAEAMRRISDESSVSSLFD